MSDLVLTETANQSAIASLSTIPAPHLRFGQATAAQPTEPKRMASEVQLLAKNLQRSYRKGKLEIPVLRGVDLQLHKGEFLAIVGQSGSGKSTLLHLLGLLDAPDQGEVQFWKHRIDNQPIGARDRLRNEEFGMIFQFYHLLPELTALENVLMPMMIRHSWFGFRLKKREYEARAQELLELVGLGHRIKHKPRELSGGEMQRTAIARALINQPQVLLADEPTGNLDAETGAEIMALLRKLNKEQALSMIMVTHDLNLAAQADRIVTLVAGKVVDKK
jgi:lipoprotein-releasing system ATP-binding protein